MTSADDRLLRGYRVIRRLSGPPEHPWPGVLVVPPSGESRVLVDCVELPDEWAGWDAASDGHVLAPLDVVRRGDGHSVVLPLCVERLDDVLTRREAAGAPLTDGERLTVAVSVLRGAAELDGAHATGTWWVTEEARPVFATTSGGADASTAAAELLRRLAHDSRRLSVDLASAADLMLEPGRLSRGAEAMEERLFAAAAPEALALTVFAPRHALGLSVHAANAADVLAEPQAEAGLVRRLARHVDADLADLFSRTTTAVWRRLRAPRRERRGGPWIAAGVITAAIVGGAALVPAASGAPAPESSIASASTTGPAEAAPESPSDAADLESIVSHLLDERSACAGAADCLAEVMEDAEASVPAGVVDLPSSERSVALLDEFGGAAVLRVSSLDGGRSQLVVVIRAEERWLLRDVHDVAEQP